MNDQLIERIKRIYAAIDAVQEEDLSNFKEQRFANDKGLLVIQEFSGGRSPAELMNVAQTVIHNIASLYDHLRGWAKRYGHDIEKVDLAFKASMPIRIVFDLWNSDKHGGAGRTSHSGLFPTFPEAYGVMQLAALPGKSAILTTGGDGIPSISGGGTCCVVITGEIFDKDGKQIGHFYDTALQAIAAWERLFDELGVPLR